MTSPYYNELQNAAEKYGSRLHNAGFEARIDPDSYRDYSVKLHVSHDGLKLGKVVLYYKPSKKSFSPRFHELTVKTYEGELYAIYEGRETHRQGYEIYIDGSFMDNRIGWGLLVLENGTCIQELSGSLTDEKLLPLRQISGELKAAMEAVKWCRSRGLVHVSIHFDYLGIRNWANRSWQAKNPVTAAYRDFMANLSGLKIDWVKVPAHTGNLWNEKVDALAKSGAKG